MMPTYFDVALRILTSRHMAEVIERIAPGQTGCVDCGHIAEHAEFAAGRRGARYCPACGVNVKDRGYVDGDLVTSLVRKHGEPGVNDTTAG